MPKKLTSIKFDFAPADEEKELIQELVELNKRVYTRKLLFKAGASPALPIPREIELELNLKPSDWVYFVIFSEGVYISFKEKPEGHSKHLIKGRKLSYAGANKTLFVRLPKLILETQTQPITKDCLNLIQLINTKGFKLNEWQVKFHSTECTYQKS